MAGVKGMKSGFAVLKLKNPDLHKELSSKGGKKTKKEYKIKEGDTQ